LVAALALVLSGGATGGGALAVGVVIALSSSAVGAIIGGYATETVSTLASAGMIAVVFVSSMRSDFKNALSFSPALRGEPQTLFVWSRFTAALGVLIGAALWLQPDPDENAASLLLFLVVLPLINAVFDSLSLGLTRYCLRQSITPAWRRWGINWRPWIWGAVDLVGAVACLFALGLALLFGIHGLNQINPLLDLALLFDNLETRPEEMRWLYLMFFSTLLPTAAHLLLVVIGFATRVPGGPIRKRAARLTRTANGLDDRTFYVAFLMGIWVTLIAAVLILPLWLMIPAAPGVNGWFTQFWIDLFRNIAQWAHILPK